MIKDTCDEATQAAYARHLHRTGVPTMPTIHDWPEDWLDENGNYEGRCPRCQLRFLGHKRRVTCKVCTQIHDLREALEMAVSALRDHDIDEAMAGEFEILTDALTNSRDAPMPTEDSLCEYCQGDPVGNCCQNHQPTGLRYFCTRDPGHSGDHVACGDMRGHNLAQWPQDPEDSLTAEECSSRLLAIIDEKIAEHPPVPNPADDEQAADSYATEIEMLKGIITTVAKWGHTAFYRDLTPEQLAIMKTAEAALARTHA